MADFRLASSQLHLTYIAAEETFALDPGSTGDLALFGGGPSGEQLTVRSGAEGVAQIVYAAPKTSESTLRTVRVKGVRIGATTAADVYSVAVADKPLRQAAKVVSSWAGAWVGCKVVGAGGAWVGTAVEPGLGTAVGGSVGCLAGAFIGYEGFSRAAGRLYDWGDARFTRIPDAPAP